MTRGHVVKVMFATRKEYNRISAHSKENKDRLGPSYFHVKIWVTICRGQMHTDNDIRSRSRTRRNDHRMTDVGKNGILFEAIGQPECAR